MSETNEAKKEEGVEGVGTGAKVPAERRMRQILIETDGTDIHLAKDETSGRIELIAILETLAAYLSRKK